MKLSLPLLFAASSLSLSCLSLFASAQVNSGNETDLVGEDADGVDVARPDWQPVPSKYNGTSTWKTCTVGNDDDCESDHFCVQHLWSYNGQLESGTGCWTKDVCSGSTSFDMFDGRQLQFFCSAEQTTGALVTPPWGLSNSNRTISNEWYSICETDSDCPAYESNPENNQQCLPVLWDVTNDGLNYANMMTCYNWDEDVCTAANMTDFGQENMNYENTEFSFYNEYSCAGSSSDSSTADGGKDMPSSSSSEDNKAGGDNVTDVDGKGSSASASFTPTTAIIVAAFAGTIGFFVTTMMV